MAPSTTLNGDGFALIYIHSVLSSLLCGQDNEELKKKLTKMTCAVCSFKTRQS